MGWASEVAGSSTRWLCVVRRSSESLLSPLSDSDPPRSLLWPPRGEGGDGGGVRGEQGLMLGVFPVPLWILLFEIGSLTEPGAQGFTKAEQAD